VNQAPIACRAVLVLGGARSGKSRYALALAEAAAPERLMIATAEALDGEMAARITRHRAERGAGWTTREAPLELAAALREEARAGRPVVVDCVTLWLSNMLLAGRVSNEVGGGVTPPSELGRTFQDWQGRANQALASACEAVVAVTAGLPRLLKPAPAPVLKLR